MKVDDDNAGRQYRSNSIDARGYGFTGLIVFLLSDLVDYGLKRMVLLVFPGREA